MLRSKPKAVSGGPGNVLKALEQFSEFMVNHPAQRHIRLWEDLHLARE